MSETLRSHMPALYRSWLPAFFDRPAIEETRATCDDCAMCDKGSDASSAGAGVPDLKAGFFRPDIKCCSYHPTLPNYLAGDALRDTNPAFAEGRRRLRAKIAARVGITPAWLAAPRKVLVLYEAARESSFGRSDSLLCPYFDREKSNCSIWPYRESICATFFCKHAAGAAGHAFWRALKRYLAHVEAALARYAATSILGRTPPDELPRNRLTREDLEDKPPKDEDYAAAWGTHVGYEEAFYVECAKLVEGLGRDELARIIDETGGTKLLEEITTRYDTATQPTLAPKLVLNREMRVTPAPGGLGVTTYSVYDPLFLTQDLYDALALFQADESTQDALERLKRDHDLELPESLLLQMQMHGVMTPPT